MSSPRARLVLAAGLLGSSAAWTLEAGARIPRRPQAHHPSDESPSTSILDLSAAEDFATEAGLTEAQLRSVYTHLFRRGGSFEPEALHSGVGLSKAASTLLCDRFTHLSSQVIERVPSEGGLKLVIELASGHRVETVLIVHEHKSSGRRRCTVCVSSQVGCARACTFCATGTMGMRAQLTAAEILEQVWHARAEAGALSEVRNVVYMGMGEPLDNFDAVCASLRGLTHQSLYDFGAKHITVSTVGASPTRIRELADTAPSVRLALSLHAATQPLRASLIPSATTLEDLTAALDYHREVTQCGLMVEYLLIAGVNDRPCDADALAAFCVEREAVASQKGRAKGYVNLIPFNPTEAGTLHGYEAPSDEAVAHFHERLRSLHGVNALVRWTSASGRDASGGCGQLVV